MKSFVEVGRRFAGIGAILAVVMIVFVPAYCSWRAVKPESRPLPERREQFFPFTGVDRADKKIGLADLSGSYWIGILVDPSTANASRSAQALAEIDDSIRKASQVLLLTFYADARSTEALNSFSRRFGATVRWKILKVDQAFLVAWTSAIDQQRSDRDPLAGLVLVDREGAIRGTYDARQDEAVQRLLDDLGTLLRAERK